MPRVRFDVTVPIFAGAVPQRDYLDYPMVLQLVKEAEKSGYDTLWVADHLTMGEENRIWEGWTVASSLANVTGMRIGTAMLSALHRNPALTAKMGATLDVISNGRLSFGLGTGWHKTELGHYGLPWYENPRERVEVLEETVQIVKKMWTERNPSFEGRHFAIADAFCEPKPVQKPHPPIWIGGGGEKYLLKLVARHADGWDIPACTPEVYAHKVEVIRRHCKDVGSDFDHIDRSIDTNIIVSDDPGAEKRISEWYDWLRGLQSEVASLKPAVNVKELFIVGSASECAKRIEEYVESGVRRFKFYFFDYPKMDSLRTIGDEIIPSFG